MIYARGFIADRFGRPPHQHHAVDRKFEEKIDENAMLPELSDFR